MVAALENMNGNERSTSKVRTMTEEDWETLISKIKRGVCTPFIGAGVYWDRYSIRSQIALEWATRHNYPLNDSGDLASVAQFLSTKFDSEYVQTMFITELGKVEVPKFDSTDPYVALASLPLPIYITTNYDDFMTQALKRLNREPKTEVCKWKRPLLDYEVSYLLDGHIPNVANPSVFHLYGYVDNPASLVLSEDDYFQFLINVARDFARTPHQIQRAMSKSLLLLGYRLNDWDFRALFHLLASCIAPNPGIAHVAVQISPVGNEASQDVIDRVQDYFDRYFRLRQLNICISSLTTSAFVAELKKRWGGGTNGNS